MTSPEESCAGGRRGQAPADTGLPRALGLSDGAAGFGRRRPSSSHTAAARGRITGRAAP